MTPLLGGEWQLANASETLPGLEESAKTRIFRRRARDPYFDSLCLAYEDVDTQLDNPLASNRNLMAIKELERKKDGLMNTIIFLLEDTDCATKH